MSNMVHSGGLTGRSASSQTPPPLQHDTAREQALDAIFWANVAANKVLADELQKMAEGPGKDAVVEAMKAAMLQNNDALRAIVREESEKARDKILVDAEKAAKRAKKAQLEATVTTSVVGARDFSGVMVGFWLILSIVFGGAGVILFLLKTFSNSPIIGMIWLIIGAAAAWLFAKASSRAEEAQRALNDRVIERLRAGSDHH